MRPLARRHFLRGALLLALSAPQGLAGQAEPGAPPPPVQVWLGAALGISNHAALAGRLGAAAERDGWEIGVRWGTTEGRETTFDGLLGPADVREEFTELALLVGRRIGGTDDSNLVLSAGLARVTGRSLTDTGIASFPDQLGLPVELHYYGRGDGRTGFGLGVFANINGERAFGGAYLGFMIIPLRRTPPAPAR